MKQIFVFLFILVLVNTTSLRSQIVINEMRASNGHVEIKNNGGTTVNIGSYWLCRYPNYNQLSTITLVCGNLNLVAGALVTVDLTYSLPADDGELGLYVASDFDNPDAIRDYVEWGFHGHVRSSVAEAAGIWADGDFVPDWSDCVSLEYDGSGDASGNWESQDVPTMPCIANNLNGCSLMPLDLLSFEVSQIENGAWINWRAVHDPTVEKIFLEHSMDQHDWEIMTTWQPQGPDFDQGEYSHHNVASGVHYYRLLTRYIDGSVEPSEIVLLRMCYDDVKVTIWPNPSKETIEVFVQVTEDIPMFDYLLVDTHGRICLKQHGSHQVQLSLSAIPEGVYFLQIPSLGVVQRVIKG
ncbi:MAG TPA: T9SS type A sorting domain-containing protein [Saprospiraceae bacterium]|nr:T9SS type A sorting domain-containing protein [Saprospiraceae bacterium]